jgi:hypothetical protein
MTGVEGLKRNLNQSPPCGDHSEILETGICQVMEDIASVADRLGDMRAAHCNWPGIRFCKIGRSGIGVWRKLPPDFMAGW